MSTTVSQRPLLTVAEAARRLSVSERTVRRMLASGRLPGIRLGGPGTPVRIDPEEFERWLYGWDEPGDAA
jgi:excisionase family DNA binding protein